jgi:hypothetical protein
MGKSSYELVLQFDDVLFLMTTVAQAKVLVHLSNELSGLGYAPGIFTILLRVLAPKYQ